MNESMMKLLKNKKLFIFDLDGTLYLDGVLFPKTIELLQHIKENHGKYVFLTNNSSRSSNDYVKKIQKLGIPCDLSNVATSTQATIHYLKSNHLNDLFYVVGTNSMITEMNEAGILTTDEYKPEIDGVILGYDTELDYKKIEIATRLITEGKTYIASHPDLVCPVGFGFVPDCGAFAKMFEYATKRTPLIIGKPKRLIVDLILERTNFLPAESVLVGDRLYTDIACGQNAGIDTILVLSGETNLEDLKEVLEQPTYVLENVAALYEVLKREERGDYE
ncbi:MAG: HAD-IIA family hydrolase [Tenericutes bacterium]|nr:HAD-IIA family hydrolase [Mycoplasmatota bacterium]